MIARLAGTLLEKNPPYLVIDINGVGYEVEAPLGVFTELPENGKQVAILIHHHFSQDSQTLYGFATLAERELFRKLLKISGIGAKMALNILSGASGDELARYVSTGDVASLTRVPGIGKKTAERIIMELRDKLEGLAMVSAAGVSAGAAPVSTDPATEAGHALTSLGYKPAEVSRMISAVAEAGMDAEEIIRRALQTRVKPNG
ncbi:MAG: Holliday junction branch migration protein RuvA [Xanthomonadales bacterium]|nr:Holliday junction branch migration protein RuvA [Gammaproteobacteria bacterium]MBT8073943.1 Holliday junction branch migration protein RuvA [Gammaproteobacteria bacterium]NNK04791.1 Holliday junction branch migration protein RuvA [Xanthomonadales bacterium]NNK98482.1 Holliday junction branch migration protein RuvA [Xanthomonadales bacterium]